MSSLPSHPILSCADAKAFEAELLRDEAAEWSAMDRAGREIACALLGDFREIGGLPAAARLLVLAGKGHNGGDALLAAKTLLAHAPGARADVLLAFGRDALRPLARRALAALQADGGERVRAVEFAELKRELPGYDVCLDGVFGFQFRPPLDDATAELLAWVNTHPRIRLRAAVDLPSGLGEEANGKTVFRADFTYATGIVKAPAVAPENAALVGRVRYLDLGFFDEAGRVVPEAPALPRRILRPSLLAPLAQLRPAQSDKRTYGHLLVVGGSSSYPGAVLMTVQAALRSGVGLLTACVPESLVPEYAAKFPEAMWVGFAEGEGGGLSPASVDLIIEKSARATALVLGPGLGASPTTLAAAEAIVRNTNIPTLLDADALRPEIVRAAAGQRIVLTPHAGEWQRLGGSAGLQPAPSLRLTSRPASEDNASAAEMVAVLKGSPTRITSLGRRSETGATPEIGAISEVTDSGGPIYHSFHGGPVLARGGSGDLLAGLIGGLLAQQPDDLLLAAARGVVWHGVAADLLARDKGQVAVQTTQLLDYLHPALHAEL